MYLRFIIQFLEVNQSIIYRLDNTIQIFTRTLCFPRNRRSRSKRRRGSWRLILRVVRAIVVRKIIFNLIIMIIIIWLYLSPIHWNSVVKKILRGGIFICYFRTFFKLTIVLKNWQCEIGDHDRFIQVFLVENEIIWMFLDKCLISI